MIALVRRELELLLDALARALAPRYNPIRVEGHTDNEPLKKTKHIYGDNRGLGSARANAVTQFLERELGIQPSRIDAVSKGEYEPIADNSSKDVRPPDRNQVP